ncbi:hypothetical protein EW026_g3012 [Hermanssonia centrifuga]|uniref:Uncharacterized protein n=1 Tax=Hermanssonia centrifuga TaxID=98765 RepID=A0A4S4KLG4_9APHY|nr:hypothetical protein EW026_g3012 [Hermanssonia centrifuga]
MKALEPYLYLQEQHGFGQNKKSSAPGEEGSDGKRDGEESSDEDNQAPEEENDDNEDEDGKSGSSSSDDDSEDPELAKLLRENSESPSSSDNDEQPRSQPADTERKGKGRFIHQEYDSPAGNISILMIACWTMRFPVMYMDFVRLIEAYELPYLDSLRLLPPSLTLHLTKQNIQALSPHFAPTPMHMHRLTSRLAKLMFRSYSILTPECNAAPLLWRAVRGLQGNPTLYTLTKQLAHTLSLTLTLHYSLAPKLKKLKTRDPEHHKYDNAPPEVSLAATVIVVLKLVYGLDGRKRTPKDIHDPACALPNLSEYLIAIKELEERERKSKTSILSASSTSSALDMDNDMLDDYLDFCEKALLPRENRNIEHGVIRDYFPLTRHLSTPDEGVRSEVFEDSLPDAMSAVRIHENSSNLGPGNAYAIYHTQDVLGSLPEDYEKIVNRAATWAGVEEDYVCGVVERFERRLARWWDKVRRREKAETLGRVDEDDE